MRSFSDAVTAKIMMKLIETAAKDGIITKEEQEVLDSIDNSLVFYKQALDEAEADGMITLQEQKRLEKIRDIVISTARIIAQESDSQIDKDELNLLMGLMCTIHVPKADL